MDSKPRASPTSIRYAVVAHLCAAATLAYLCRGALAVPAETIGRDLELTTEEMGLVMSAFFFSYAVFQVPAGRLGEVTGSRKALALYAIVWSVATAALGLATGFWCLLVLRLVMGTAQAGLFPCSVNTIATWLPQSRRALACGALGSFMGIGGAVSLALTGFLLRWISWQEVFFLLPIPGVIWALGFLGWFRDSPEDHPSVNSRELEIIRGADVENRPADDSPANEGAAAEAHPPQGPGPWLQMLASHTLWLICGQQFFRAAGSVFYLSWFPSYLKETYDVAPAELGILSSLPLLAQVAGSLIGGMVVDAVWNRTGSLRLSRQGVAVCSMLGYAGCFLITQFFVADALTAVFLITAGHFVGTLTGPCGYAISIDVGGTHIPTVFGTMNMCGNLGAAVFPAAFAYFVGVTAWGYAPALLAANYIAAAACWALVNPHRRVFRERST